MPTEDQLKAEASEKREMMPELLRVKRARKQVAGEVSKLLKSLVGDYEDVNRVGLRGTPERSAKAWDELLSGYRTDPMSVMKCFDSDGYEEIVMLRNIDFYSLCEHHLLPFYGKATIAYLPDKRVLGISKLARLLEVYSRRLQIQERLCSQITTALMECLKPKAAACIIEAKHMCMVMRGIKKANSVMVTSSVRGSFRHSSRARAELMRLKNG